MTLENLMTCVTLEHKTSHKSHGYISSSKDGILQQSQIELILTLSLGFREERVRTAV